MFIPLLGLRPTLRELHKMTPPLPWIPNISFTRWSQEALYLTGENKFLLLFILIVFG